MNRHDLHSQLTSMRKQLDLLIDLVGLQEPAAASSSSTGRSEYFDHSNDAHMAEAHRLFDGHNLDDYRRGWFLNRRLHGVKMIDLADVIDTEVRAYNPRPANRRRSEPSARSRGRGY